MKAELIEQIHGALRRHPEVEATVLYGSRVKGNHREGSDIDLSLSGDISFASLGDIVDELDDLLLVYTIDVAVFDHLNSQSLKNHIRRVGKVFGVRTCSRDFNQDKWMTCLICRTGVMKTGFTIVVLSRGSATAVFKSVPARIFNEYWPQAGEP